MKPRYSMGLGLTLAIALISCAASRVHTSSPEPRPLGGEFSSCQPSQHPQADSASIPFEEPTGVITLREALALALMNNPELAVFSWELRA